MRKILLVVCLACTALRACAVCPAVTKAPRHFSVVAAASDIRLPDGGVLRGLSYNGTYVGPTLTAVLGQEVSIDLISKVPEGMRMSRHGCCGRHNGCTLYKMYRNIFLWSLVSRFVPIKHTKPCMHVWWTAEASYCTPLHLAASMWACIAKDGYCL